MTRHGLPVTPPAKPGLWGRSLSRQSFRPSYNDDSLSINEALKALPLIIMVRQWRPNSCTTCHSASGAKRHRN